MAYRYHSTTETRIWSFRFETTLQMISCQCIQTWRLRRFCDTCKWHSKLIVSRIFRRCLITCNASFSFCHLRRVHHKWTYYRNHRCKVLCYFVIPHKSFWANRGCISNFYRPKTKSIFHNLHPKAYLESRSHSTRSTPS